MNKITVFLGGDIYGESGLKALEKTFPAFKKNENIIFAVINGENASGGKGITEHDAGRVFSAGIDVITGGNHILEKKESADFFEIEQRVLRPANYPDTKIFAAYCGATPGRGFGVYQVQGILFAVLNLQGREYMNPIDCPFAAAQKYAELADKQNALLFVDFHAESNEEKEALGIFLDGKSCAVCGTHTHIQTADERILPRGTAYITDLGMTGDANSVIGTKPDIAIRRNLTQILYKLENTEGEGTLQGVLLDIDADEKKALAIRRISFI